MTEYETQEQLDDAFENQMELLQEQKRLQDCINYQEDEVDNLRDQYNAAQQELCSLQDELDEVNGKIILK